MKRKKAIIFDCDGVLVDTEYLKYLAWQKAIQECGSDLSIQDYCPLIGLNSQAILQALSKNKKINFQGSVISRKRQLYAIFQTQGVPLFNDAISYVKKLTAQNSNYKIGLASSAPHHEIQINIKHAALEGCFDVIISGSEDLKNYIDYEGTNKPKPYIYLEAARQLGVNNEQCLVFEDSQVGVEAAKKAGMHVIAIPNQFTIEHDFHFADKVIHPKEFNSLFL